MASQCMFDSIATIFLFLLLTITAQAQSTSKTKLFLPIVGYDKVSWFGSILGACQDSTTYALRCTGTPTVSPPNRFGFASSLVAEITEAAAHMCDMDKPAYTITEGPSGFHMETETTSAGVDVLETVSCAISSMTSASCAATVEAQSLVYSATATAPAIYAGAQFPAAEVTLVAGLPKLAQASSSVCQATSLAPRSLPILGAVVAFTVGICIVLAL